jgi:hypothetical protein
LRLLGVPEQDDKKLPNRPVVPLRELLSLARSILALLPGPSEQCPGCLRERYHLDGTRGWIVQLYEAWGKPEKAAEWRKN